MTDYEAPTITELGSVADFTRATGGFSSFDRNGYFGFLGQDLPTS
jgi:hypothetical protein